MKDFAEDLNLREAISSHHNEEGPATYHRGSKQIDGIFVSQTISVVKAGFMEFGELPTDHRAIWFEIAFVNAFGYNMAEVVTPAARRLKCNDPKVQIRWIELYKEYLADKNVTERMFDIERNMELPLPPHLAREYEKVIEIRHQAIKYADKHCRKLWMGKVPYSPEVKKAGIAIQLWNGIITKKSGCKYSNKKIKKLASTLEIKNPMALSLQEAKDRLNEAWINYKKKKEEAAELRTAYLKEKAKAIAEETDEDKDNVYNQLIEREQIRDSFRRIKYTLNKLKGGGVTQVEVEREDGSLEEITTKRGIEKAGMNENKEKYSQTNNTPCMKEPLKSMLAYNGNTEAGREILDGNFKVPEEVENPYAQEFFDQLERANLIEDPPPACISTKDFKEGWKVMKEQTSAGISGLHFGHLKACATDNLLAEFEASLANVSYATGYVPVRWKKGVSVMIQKKALVDLITKLRTITLLEADFNFNNKVLGRTTLQHAERNNLFPNEQYGSRKNKSAIDHATHKKLTYDIIRQTRLPAALCSNDAKSCFDRVVHSVACLAYERLGIKQPPVHAMVSTIQKMKHHIRTTYGDSQLALDSTGLVKPFQGVLQGNGASPTSWVIISAALIEMMRSAGNGGHLVSPISGEKSHIIGYAFVDDTDLIQVDMRSNTITVEETLNKMQESIDRWEGGLKMTGGAIVPIKSWVYPIDFKFDDRGRWTYKSCDEINFPFSVKDHDDERNTLRSIEPSKGKETLGVILAPDGNNKDLVKELRTKSETWAEYVNTGHLARDDVWRALDCTITATLKYPLQTATLSEEECKYILAPVLKVALPKSHVCSTFPRAVVQGPKSELGFGKTNLYNHSGIAKISLLYEHLALQTMTGELLRCSIEAAKVEIGIGRNLFTLDFKKYGCLCTDSTVKYIWKFAFEKGIIIEDNVTSDLQLQRENDLFLTEQFVECGFTDKERAQINICRNYLRVTTLADITKGGGDRFTNLALEGERDTQRPARYSWARQERPTNEHFRLWRSALRKSFPKIGGSQKLHYTVKKWTSKQTGWKWFYEPRSQSLYEKSDNGWRIYKRHSRRGRLGHSPLMKYSNQALRLPLTNQLATVEVHNENTCTLTGWSGYTPDYDKEPNTDAPYTKSEFSHMNPIYKNNTDRVKTGLAQAIKSHSTRFVSDGSSCPHTKTGTAAFIGEDSTKEHQIEGSIIVPGVKKVQNSTRSELAGILAILQYIISIQDANDISGGKVEIGCDGLAALKAIWRIDKGFVRAKDKHFDILQAIKQCEKIIKASVIYRHVKGHQDDTKDFNQLDRWAQLNVMADAMAKERLRPIRHNDHEIGFFSLPLTPCYIRWINLEYNTVQISSNLSESLHEIIGGKNLDFIGQRKKTFLDTEQKI